MVLSSFSCLHPVLRFIADKWSMIPKEPTFPAFFLGALSVGIYPSDTFLKLEVRRTPFLPCSPIFLGL